MSSRNRVSGSISAKDKIADLQNKLNELEEEENRPVAAPPADTSALGDLKDLIFLGAATKTVKISNFEFELSTLTISDRKTLIRILNEQGKDRMIENIKQDTLALTIKTVNGAPLESLYTILGGTEDLSEDPVRAKMFVVRNLQSTLIDALYEESEKLSLESQKMVVVDDIKK